MKILLETAVNMPGCFNDIVDKDAADENVIWVTEAWDSVTSHDTSLSLPSVKNALPQAKSLVATFDKIAVTCPIGGIGLGYSGSH